MKLNEAANIHFYYFSEVYKTNTKLLKQLRSILSQIESLSADSGDSDIDTPGVISENIEEDKYINLLTKLIDDMAKATQMCSRIYRFFVSSRKDERTQNILNNIKKGGDSDETKSQALTRGLKSPLSTLKNFIDRLEEEEQRVKEMAWGPNDFREILSSVPKNELKNFMLAIDNKVPINSAILKILADISIMYEGLNTLGQGKYNESLYSIMKSGDVTKTVNVLKTAKEKMIDFVKLGKTIMTKLRGVEANVYKDIEKHIGTLKAKGLSTQQIKLLLKYLKFQKEEVVQEQEQETAGPSLDHAIINRYFNDTDAAEIESAFNLIKDDAEILKMLGIEFEEPEPQQEEELENYMETTIQISSQNAQKESQVLRKFFSDIKKQFNKTNENFSNNELNDYSEEVRQYILTYARSKLLPNERKTFISILEREDNKAKISAYLQQVVFKDNESVLSLSKRAINKAFEIGRSIQNGNEWQSIINDKEEVITSVGLIRRKTAVKLHTGQDTAIVLELQDFLNHVNEGNISLTKTKEEIKSELTKNIKYELQEDFTYKIQDIVDRYINKGEQKDPAQALLDISEFINFTGDFKKQLGVLNEEEQAPNKLSQKINNALQQIGQAEHRTTLFNLYKTKDTTTKQTISRVWRSMEPSEYAEIYNAIQAPKQSKLDLGENIRKIIAPLVKTVVRKRWQKRIM